MGLKRCSRCGESKDTDANTFGRRAAMRDGFLSACRSCNLLACKQWYSQNSDAIGEKARAARAAKPSTRAPRRVVTTESERVRQAKWYAENTEKARANGARYYAANAERSSARGAKWRAENPEKWRGYGQAFARAHPEKVRAAATRWTAANPEKVLAFTRARRARVMGANGRGVTPKQWRQIERASLGLCAYCNTRTKLTLDHIDPLSRGGAHDIDNVAAACQSCNSKKKDTPLLIWLARSAA